MTGRLVNAGFCTFRDVWEGHIGADRYFELLSLADWKLATAAKLGGGSHDAVPRNI